MRDLGDILISVLNGSSWFKHMLHLKNNCFFPLPCLDFCFSFLGLQEVGFQCDKNQGECRAKFACHLDCFAWVKRDSYLPQGSQGLKVQTSNLVSISLYLVSLMSVKSSPISFVFSEKIS